MHFSFYTDTIIPLFRIPFLDISLKAGTHPDYNLFIVLYYSILYAAFVRKNEKKNCI